MQWSKLEELCMKNKFLVFLFACFILSTSTSAFAYEQDAVNFNNTGINFTKKGDYPQAITYFKKAIEADSSMTNAYYNLGSVYKYTGNTDKAINVFLLLLRNAPGDDETAYILSGLYFDKQDYEKALLYLNSIDKTSTYYKDSIELFKKINAKINESVINEPQKTETPQKSNDIPTTKFVFKNFSGPTGIAQDSNGNLYVANYSSDMISVVSQDGKLKKTIKNNLIRGPVGIAIDANNNLYVANYLLNNIVKIDSNGEIKVLLKDVLKPYYLYFNNNGVLFVSEQDKNTVIRVGIPD